MREPIVFRVVAGEQRTLVEPIAAELDQRGYSVFFYAWPQFVSELAKPNLDKYLRDIYGAQTTLLVPVLSAAYAHKPWTDVVELTIVRELMFDRRDAEVMTLRVDETPIEGFSKLHGYVDIRGRTAKDVAGLIEMRLKAAGVTSSPGAIGSLATMASPRSKATTNSRS